MQPTGTLLPSQPSDTDKLYPVHNFTSYSFRDYFNTIFQSTPGSTELYIFWNGTSKQKCMLYLFPLHLLQVLPNYNQFQCTCPESLAQQWPVFFFIVTCVAVCCQHLTFWTRSKVQAYLCGNCSGWYSRDATIFRKTSLFCFRFYRTVTIVTVFLRSTQQIRLGALSSITRSIYLPGKLSNGFYLHITTMVRIQMEGKQMYLDGPLA